MRHPGSAPVHDSYSAPQPEQYEQMADCWSRVVAQYPRTVIGKFVTAPDGDFSEVGIRAKEMQGEFTNRNPAELVTSTNLSKLSNILGPGTKGVGPDRVAALGSDFVVGGSVVGSDGSQEVRLSFIQYLNSSYTRSARSTATPLATTFYLPVATAAGLMADLRKYPDLMHDVYERAVAPGLPPHVYRTRAQGITLVSPEAIESADNATSPQDKFTAIKDGSEKYLYARPRSNEEPRTAADKQELERLRLLGML